MAEESIRLSIRLVADTQATREKGLMFAEPLEEHEAALFVFPHSERYSFWNKNVSFGLSLAFLDDSGQIVDFADMDAQSPDSVSPSKSARYVVEAQKGAFDKMGVKKGDIVRYKDHTLHIVPVTSQVRRG